MKLFEIAKQLACELVGDGEVEIHRVAGIDEAGPGDLTFVSNRKYISHIKDSHATAIILGHDAPEVAIPSLRTDNPYLVFARALELFYSAPSTPPGIHGTAIIASSAAFGKNASIGAFCVIGDECRLGDNVVLHSHVVLYPNVHIGDNAILHARATVRENCRLGNRVVLQNGAVIGSDGFGFAPDKDGTYYKIVQTGRVLIEDDVEIGANTTIDRAAVGDTVIRRGAKLDNLVQIGHGSEIGANTVVAAQVGVAGSTRLGSQVRVGGQVGFAGHLQVGDGAVITAQSGTSHDIEPGAVISGSPAIDNGLWLRATAAFGKLPELVRKVRQLEKQLALLLKKYPL